MFTIYAPNDQFTGERAGVSFVNGQGETENEIAVEWFKQNGYEVEGEPETPQDPPQDPQNEGSEHEPLDVDGLTFEEIAEKYTNKQMVAELKRLGVGGYSGKNGVELAEMVVTATTPTE